MPALSAFATPPVWTAEAGEGPLAVGVIPLPLATPEGPIIEPRFFAGGGFRSSTLRPAFITTPWKFEFSSPPPTPFGANCWPAVCATSTGDPEPCAMEDTNVQHRCSWIRSFSRSETRRMYSGGRRSRATSWSRNMYI